MRCRDCHHFLCCARVLKSLFVFSEFGFFLGVGRTLPLPISLQLQLSLPFVLRNRRMLHMSLGLTEPERYGQNPISAQVKGKAHPTCNWPLGACSPSTWPCAPSWLLNVFFGGVPSPDKEEWDHVIVGETEFFWFMAYVPSSLWSIFAPGTWGALRPLWLWPPCSASQCFSYVADNPRANGMSDVSFWGVGLFTTFCRLTPKVRICNQLAITGLYRSTEAGSQLSCLTSVAECVRRAFHLQVPRCKFKAGRFF